MHTYYSYQGLLHTLLLARDIICPLKLHIARMKKDHVHYFIIDVKKVPENSAQQQVGRHLSISD